jgi:hypothetical protein
MQDGKYLGWNITGRQALGVCALVALGFLVIYLDAVLVGYVLAVLALSAFFLVVGFDIGIPKEAPVSQEEPVAPDNEPEKEIRQ